MRCKFRGLRFLLRRLIVTLAVGCMIGTEQCALTPKTRSRCRDRVTVENTIDPVPVIRVHGCPPTVIQQLPNEFVACLKTAGELTLFGIAEKWAAEISTPGFTHSVRVECIQDDLALEEALSVIGPIAQLARRQQNAQAMYILTEA